MSFTSNLYQISGEKIILMNALLMRTLQDQSRFSYTVAANVKSFSHSPELNHAKGSIKGHF